MDPDIAAEDPTNPFFADLMAGLTASQDQWLVQATDPAGQSERPSTPADQEVMRGYEDMADTCVCPPLPSRSSVELTVSQMKIEPWHLYDEKQPLHFIVNSLKGFIGDIVATGTTPFLHRYLYRDHMPPCVVSCFAASALYANRTPANSAVVMRALDSSVRELRDAEAARFGVATTPLDRLARAQALFLYLIIRLLDGDVVLRAHGERDLPLLRTWLHDLGRIRDNLGDEAASKQLPREWEVSLVPPLSSTSSPSPARRGYLPNPSGGPF